MKNIIFCVIVVIYSCSSGPSSANKMNDEEAVIDTVLYDRIEKCSEEDGNLIFYKYTVDDKVGILDKDKNILVEAKYENCIFERGFYVGIMKDEVLEAFKKDGTLFVDATKGIKNFYKEELCDGRFFYYTFSTGDCCGAIDEDGYEIFPINYKGLEYFDKEEDTDEGYELIQTFAAEDKSGSTRLLYVYIDDDNKVKRYPLPLQEGIYESKQYYNKDEDEFGDSEDIRQIRVYKNYILLDRIKIPFYANRDGSKYYRGADEVLYCFSDNYMSFHYDSDFSHRDYQKNGKLSEDDFTFRQSHLCNTEQNERSGSENDNFGLLYKGTYTSNSQGYCEETGNYSDAMGPDFTMLVEIYDDYIIVSNMRYDYIGSSNGWKIFHDDIENSGMRKYYKVNPSNFEMSQYTISRNLYTGGNVTITYAMTKGQTQFSKQLSSHGNVSIGNNRITTSTSNSNNHKSQSYKKDCRLCLGSGKCITCDGDHVYLNPLTGKYVTCPNCNTNGACSSCGGSGKKR